MKPTRGLWPRLLPARLQYVGGGPSSDLPPRLALGRGDSGHRAPPTPCQAAVGGAPSFGTLDQLPLCALLSALPPARSKFGGQECRDPSPAPWEHPLLPPSVFFTPPGLSLGGLYLPRSPLLPPPPSSEHLDCPGDGTGRPSSFWGWGEGRGGPRSVGGGLGLGSPIGFRGSTAPASPATRPHGLQRHLEWPQSTGPTVSLPPEALTAS